MNPSSDRVADAMLTDLRLLLTKRRESNPVEPTDEYIEHRMEFCRRQNSIPLWKSFGFYLKSCARLVHLDGKTERANQLWEKSRICDRCAAELIPNDHDHEPEAA